MDPIERTLRARLAAHMSWANAADRSARTERAREAAAERFEKKAREMHPDATDREIVTVAESLRKAYYTGLGLRSAQARRRKRQGGGSEGPAKGIK